MHHRGQNRGFGCGTRGWRTSGPRSRSSVAGGDEVYYRQGGPRNALERANEAWGQPQEHQVPGQGTESIRSAIRAERDVAEQGLAPQVAQTGEDSFQPGSTARHKGKLKLTHL